LPLTELDILWHRLLTQAPRTQRFQAHYLLALSPMRLVGWKY